MKLSSAVSAAALALARPSTQSLLPPLGDQPVGTCCSILEAAGLEHVLYPEDQTYQDRIESYFSISARLTPGCIVQPTSAEEVALAVKVLTHGTTCKFAVRGGGHTAFPGAANINNGVTIDLGLMRDTTYDAEKKVAHIQPGQTWAEVYGDLEPYGVTVPGGRTGTVGIGGFLTGGGNTFYAARHGLGCDNVVNFQVVLSTGQIVDANAKKNKDLFKALKGGGSNFGIVTRFDMQAYDADLLWGGLVSYDVSATDQFVDAYHSWTNNIHNYPDGSIIPFWSYDPTIGGEVILLAYEDITGVEEPAAFDEFLAIDNVLSSSMRLATHKNITDELEIAPGYRNIVFTFTFKNEKAVFHEILTRRTQFVEDFKTQSPDGDFYVHGIFQAIPTLFAEHAVAKGGNMLGLDRVEDNAVLFQIQMMVKGEYQEAEARSRLVDFFDGLKEHTVEVGADVDWVYLNYADYTQDPFAGYPADNVAFMKEVAKKYDPRRVFQERMPGGFKVTEA